MPVVHGVLTEVRLRTGRDGQVPAYILDEVDGYTVLRYMIAEGASNKAAPTGKGDGAYEPLGNVESVVAIIGSAHVRGICKQFDSVVDGPSLDVQDLCQS